MVTEQCGEYGQLCGWIVELYILLNVLFPHLQSLRLLWKKNNKTGLVVQSIQWMWCIRWYQSSGDLFLASGWFGVFSVFKGIIRCRWSAFLAFPCIFGQKACGETSHFDSAPEICHFWVWKPTTLRPGTGRRWSKDSFMRKCHTHLQH